MSIVSDASPLIALEGIQELGLLRTLYAAVQIPPAVSQEVSPRRTSPLPPWIQVVSLAAPVPDLVARRRLGRGESEAIALALELSAPLLLVDEFRARALARSLGLNVVGVGGVLVAAKRKGLIPQVLQPLDDLARVGFRLSAPLRREILRLAGESDPAATPPGA